MEIGAERVSTRLETVRDRLDREILEARNLLTKVTSIREKLLGITPLENEVKKVANPNCLLEELEDKLSTLAVINTSINQELNNLSEII